VSPISVVIPVGPSQANRRWLLEAQESLERQTLIPDEIVFINDGRASTQEKDYCRPSFILENTMIHHYTPPWKLGVAHAFNFGVALARNECVFMLGSDDTLEPECLERCVEAYEGSGSRDAYYWVPVKYMHDGSIQHVPCGAAMVTKGLWQMTGGFPTEAAVGASDAALLSIMMVHMPDRIVQVGSKPLYNYRSHPESDTSLKMPHWHQIIVDTRNVLTSEWKAPEWTQNFW